MKKNVFHRELLPSLGLATGKAKRAAKILTSNQQQPLQVAHICWVAEVSRLENHCCCV
jgi:hypothetical protein